MMNLLEVQDDLKNFSQDQLVKEMQQPSGVAPQFLVLSELNRRKRVKGDFEARQAKQQPTVAEEAVAAAGVPQQGMMGMSEAMAPASVDSGGIGAMMPKTMKMGGEVDSYADGGVIRAQDGLPNFRGFGKLGPDMRGDSFRRINDPTITDDFEQTGNVDVGGLFGFGQPEPRSLAEIAQTGPRTMEELEILENSEKQAEAVSPLPIEPETKKPAPETPKLNLTNENDALLSLEQELRNRQQSIEDDREFAKYMAIAQAGFSILGSDKPTLAQAIGEGGTKGLAAYNEAQKRYGEGLTDLLNARAKLKQARITAAGKGRLTRSGAITAIASYNNAITAIQKEIAELTKLGGENAPGVAEQVKALRDRIINLETEKSQLYDVAQIRPRAAINVGKLPEVTTKSA